MIRALSTFSFCLLALASPAQEMLFKQQWQPGFTHNYTQRTVTDVTMTLGTKTAQNHMDVSVGVLMLAETKDNVTTLTTKFTSVRGGVDFLGQKIAFDSDKPDETGQGATKLVGQEFITKIDATGKVLEMQGLEQLAGALGNKLDVTQFREMVQSSHMKAFPAQAIPVGATWKYRASIELAQAGVLTPEISYRFAEMVDWKGSKVAKVEYSGKLSGTLNSEGQESTMEIGDGSEINGTLLYSPDWTIIVEQRQAMTLNLILKQPNASPLSLPVKSDLQLTLDSRDPLPAPTKQ